MLSHLQIHRDRVAHSPQRHQKRGDGWWCRPDVFRSAFFSHSKIETKARVLTVAQIQLLAAARRIASRARYSAPVAGTSRQYSRLYKYCYIAQARRQAAIRLVHMACSERLRHGAASSEAGWPKHSAAAQLESYLDYGASRSAEVGVRPSTSCQLEYRQRQALVPRQGTRCGGDVAGTGTGTQCRPERRQPRRCPCAVASVPAALSVLTVGQLKGPWPKYALRLEYDAAPNRMPYLQGCAPPVL
ncbi:hypothetical protein LI328DRAFT_156204 [Trichoderma asperelloides]|nr:hypothetical protein LI328DRAFT_156204 [Trichoderma asperelloides]